MANSGYMLGRGARHFQNCVRGFQNLGDSGNPTWDSSGFPGFSRFLGDFRGFLRILRIPRDSRGFRGIPGFPGDSRGFQGIPGDSKGFLGFLRIIQKLEVKKKKGILGVSWVF